METTLVMIKPDSANRNIVGKILNEYEQRGLEVIELKKITTTREKMLAHYDEHKSTPTFGELIDAMSDKTAIIILIKGYDAINRVRSINGSTDPSKANPNTIRSMYGTSYRYNCVHASDSLQSAKREIKLWFEYE